MTSKQVSRPLSRRAVQAALVLGLVWFNPAVGLAADRPAASGPTTFTVHVAPIIFQNCASCHRPGEAAPFTLLTYEDVRKRGKMIAEVTARKIMPPWHAETGHVEFLNARVLSAAQIATLQAWHQQGMPEGEPARLPKPPTFTAGWQLGQPDLIVKMDQPFKIYAEGRDIYRNFVFPLNLTEDKWVKAVEFRPSARSVVHHALFYQDATGIARKLDAEDPLAGYKGVDRASRSFNPAGGWAVGSNVRVLPEGLAYTYAKGTDLVVQTHFHPVGKAEEETSTVGIHFTDRAPSRTFVGVQLPPVFGEISGMDIPTGEKNYVLRSAFTLPVDVEAFAVAPHAHYLGKTMVMTATLPEGKVLTLLKITNWDFAWQEQYTYKQHVPLPRGTRLEVAMSYDNSAENPKNPKSPPVRVKWGPNSTDEMGSISLQVIPVREPDGPVLRAALRDFATDILIDRVVGEPRRAAMVQAMLLQFDANGNGKLDDAERPALRTFIQSSAMFPPQLNNTF